MNVPFTDPDLSGRSALITGGGTGIGRALALALAARGARVWITGRREEPLEETASHHRQTMHWFAESVTDSPCPDLLVEDIRARSGSLDVLVNNAAILGPVGRLEEIDPSAVPAVFDINIFGTYLVTYRMLPLLRAAGPGASIINLSSGVGRRGRGGWGPYAASKFAVEGLTQVWADEFRGEGIAVNAVNPGGTATAMRAAAAPSEDPSTIPQTQDILPAFLFLLSEEALGQGVSGVSLDARDFLV